MNLRGLRWALVSWLDCKGSDTGVRLFHWLADRVTPKRLTAEEEASAQELRRKLLALVDDFRKREASR